MPPLSKCKQRLRAPRHHHPSTQQRNEQISQPLDTQNFIDNQLEPSSTSQWIDLYDPATNNLVTRVPQSTDEEMKRAVDSAEKAWKGWRAQSVMARQQVMFKYVSLIKEHHDRLAASITLEQGKTFADAKGDVLRGLQVAETACGITTQLSRPSIGSRKGHGNKKLPGVTGCGSRHLSFQLPRHDSSMDHSRGYYHWEHLHH